MLAVNYESSPLFCREFAGPRPGEIQPGVDALVERNAILEGTIVEGLARELRQAGVHAVLHLTLD